MSLKVICSSANLTYLIQYYLILKGNVLVLAIGKLLSFREKRENTFYVSARFFFTCVFVHYKCLFLNRICPAPAFFATLKIPTNRSRVLLASEVTHHRHHHHHAKHQSSSCRPNCDHGFFPLCPCFSRSNI